MELHQNEMIKQIEGFPKYYITSEGRVWSEYTKKWLKPYINTRGNHKRAVVSLGRKHKFYVHRLVAEAFIPNPDNLPEVDHKDTNGLNNSVSNLQWVTHTDNLNNTLSKEHIKQNTGYFVEIEEIETGKLYIGYEEAASATGKSVATIANHTKNKVKNPKWKLTGKRYRNKN